MQNFDPIGVFTAIATPFSEDSKELDKESLEKLIAYQIEAGVNGLVIIGSTGEGQTLKDDEVKSIANICREKTSGKCSLIGGIGSSSTEFAIERAKMYGEMGVDSLLVVVPPYNKPSQEGMLAHFSEIKKSTKLPIIAYNIPGRSAANMLPATVGQLARDGIICALKEATGSMDQMIDTILAVEGKAAILSGEDSLFLPCLSVGGLGIISASANVAPKSFVKIKKYFDAANLKEALKIHEQLLPLIRTLFVETNPIPVKAALQLKGVIKSSSVRLPLIKASDLTINRLKALLGTVE